MSKRKVVAPQPSGLAETLHTYKAAIVLAAGVAVIGLGLAFAPAKHVIVSHDTMANEGYDCIATSEVLDILSARGFSLAETAKQPNGTVLNAWVNKDMGAVFFDLTFEDAYSCALGMQDGGAEKLPEVQAELQKRAS